MKKNHDPKKSKTRRLSLMILFSFFVFCQVFYSQQSYTFTNAGATGSLGPNQGQINTTYTNTNLSNSVLAVAGIQYWVVPSSANYSIEAVGATGGGVTGGMGAIMKGNFFLTAGDTILILAGQMGIDGLDGSTTAGGGSYVVLRNPGSTVVTSSGRSVTPLVIAGGGGGNPGVQDNNSNASLTTSANAGNGGTGSGIGGINGNGGGISVPSGNSRGGGGGGFLTNGEQTNTCGAGGLESGKSFLNGGTGGLSTSCSTGYPGGFGGGAGSISSGWRSSGGGGGYSGGGGGQTNSVATNHRGGGGGSYNNGANQVNAVATATGHGRVTIGEVCNISLAGSASNSLNPSICSGQSITLTTNAVSNYLWSTGAITSSIVVTPTSTTVYSLSAMSASNCTTVKSITVTVSAGLPTLSIVSSTNQTCLGKTVTLTASGALTYSWTGGITNGVSFTPSVTTTFSCVGGNGCGTVVAVSAITVSPLPVSVVSSATAICAGSPATLTAVAPATTYTWQPGNVIGASTIFIVNPSVSTIYSVTASDGTCAGTGTLVLIANPIPTITIVASSSFICTGYPVTMTVSGGVGYTWTPGNLAGTTVTVYPTAPTLYSVSGSNSAGCISAASQIVLTTPSPTVIIVANNTFVCAGAAANLNAGGADTYAWSNGPVTPSITVNPTVTTTYSATGTDTNSGCTDTELITVNVFNPSVTTTGAATICSGASATLSASGADGYYWDNGSTAALIVVTPTVLTGYTLSASSSSNNVTCVTIHTFEVKVNPIPAVTVAASQTLACRTAVILTAGGASSYSWSTGSTSQTIITSSYTNAVIVFAVTGTGLNGCSNTATVLVKLTTQCVGIDEVFLNNQFSIYPNPNNGEFTIKAAADISLKLMNILGQEIRDFRLTELNNHEISVTDLPAGVYFMVAKTGDHQFKQKIIVSK